MDDEDQLVFKCTECGIIFPRELAEMVMKGKTIYCEKCGYPFKSDFTKKDYKKIGSPQIYDATSIKTGKSKKVKRVKPKKLPIPTIARVISPVDEKAQPTPPIPPRPFAPLKPPAPLIDFKINTQNYTPTKVPKKTLTNLNKWVGFFNNLVNSPLLVVIGILVAVGGISQQFLGKPLEISRLFSIIFNIIAISIRMLVLVKITRFVQSNFTKRIASGDYSRMGIELIIFGGIAAACYGLGIIILVEGILILVYVILLKRNKLIDHENKSLPVELSYEIFAFNIVEDVIYVMSENLYQAEKFILALGVSLFASAIGNLNFGLIWSSAAFFIVALFMLSYVKNTTQPTLGSTPYMRLDENLLIKSVILGGLSLGFGGSGIILLIVSILLFVYRAKIPELTQKLESRPKLHTEPPIQESRKTSSSETEPSDRYSEKIGNKKETTGPPIQQKEDKAAETQKQSEKIPVIESKETKPAKILQPIPVSGVGSQKSGDVKDLTPKEIAKSKVDSDILQLEKKTEKDSQRQAQLDLYVDRLFTVLSEETRERLLNVDIPDSQKWDVVEEFVNLKEEQQKKYLEELEDVNREISEKLIQRVMNMKIDEMQKKSVIKQLIFMTPKNQSDFIDYLESEEQ